MQQITEENSISISPAIKGYVTVSDLLSPEGTVLITMPCEDIKRIDGLLFQLYTKEYQFALSIQGGKIILQRCRDRAILVPNLDTDPNYRKLFISWSPTLLKIVCGTSKADEKIQETLTTPTFPPVSLLRFARLRKLLPTGTFPTSESLRDTVYEALSNLQDDIRRLGAYNAFWDERYEGRRRKNPVPKKETDIHPTLNLLLSEWAFLRSIEIIPESKTGVGNLDFDFVGYVEEQGPTSICVEVKRAHADDLLHGLEVQLPAYMQRKRAFYGAFVISWFKGEWFDKPTSADIERISKTPLDDSGESRRSEFEQFEFAITGKAVTNADLQNIRVFVIDVTKPITASRA